MTTVVQTQICACGCGERFDARRSYRHRDSNGAPSFPIFKRGHHPNCRKNQTSVKPAWNTGLTKGDHPSMQRMGFQPGHKPFNDWSAVNSALRDDAEAKARWIASKKGQVPWNKGLTKAEYPKGIKAGQDHGNWLGGRRGVRDQAIYADFRKTILKRDNYTCQLCGDRNRKGRGSRINLEVDHITPVCAAPDRILDPENARTLCAACHRRTETFGTKVKSYLRKAREE